MSGSDPNSFGAAALELDAKVRAASPLVHHITNFVVMNFTANVTLALGAQPVMAHAAAEVEEMVGYAATLLLNIGTLDDAWIASMLLAGKAATARGVPIVMDPVGAGATKLRTDTALKLLDNINVSVLRGNAGEVLSVAGEKGKVRGVDSTAESLSATQVAQKLAKERGLVVAVTGPVDVITDGEKTFEVANGHPLMSRVTGTGCAATTAISCFVGVADPSERCFAAAAALAIFGAAGELAARKASGPGIFVPAFLDALYHVPDLIKESQLRIRQVS